MLVSAISSIAAYSVWKYGRLEIALACAERSLEAATSSMALVIWRVDCMLLIRVLIAFVDKPAMCAPPSYWFCKNSATRVVMALFKSASVSLLRSFVSRIAVRTSAALASIHG